MGTLANVVAWCCAYTCADLLPQTSQYRTTAFTTFEYRAMRSLPWTDSPEILNAILLPICTLDNRITQTIRLLAILPGNETQLDNIAQRLISLAHSCRIVMYWMCKVLTTNIFITRKKPATDSTSLACVALHRYA